jgi:hypothetical protein
MRVRELRSVGFLTPWLCVTGAASEDSAHRRLVNLIVVDAKTGKPVRRHHLPEPTNLGRCLLPVAAKELKFPQLTGAYRIENI